MKKNLVLTGVAIVAVGAIGYLVVNGIPSTGPGAQGTVGAATRHQTGQITKGDVVLQSPETQAFLQSDVYDKLVKDAAFRDAMKSDAFREAMKADAFRVGQ